MWRVVKQFATRVTASVESAAQSIENHEALVDSAVRSMRRSAARARVQLERVRRDGERMDVRIEQLERDAERWRERALSSEATDEGKALACVKRKRRAEVEREALLRRRDEHRHVEERLARDIERVSEKLEELTAQRNLLRTRESRADALAVAAGSPTSVLAELDGVIERWESVIVEREIEASCGAEDADLLDAEFRDAEEEAALRAELDELRGSAAQSE